MIHRFSISPKDPYPASVLIVDSGWFGSRSLYREAVNFQTGVGEMLRRDLAIITLLASVFAAGPVSARTTSATIKADFVSENPGACSSVASDYDSFCPSTTECVCDTYQGTISGGLVGKGSATVTITRDVGANTNGSAAIEGCEPFFGIASFTTNRESEDDNVTGTVCSAFSGTKDSVSGGFGIESGVAVGGWGTIKGTLDQGASSKNLKITLKAQF